MGTAKRPAGVMVSAALGVLFACLFISCDLLFQGVDFFASPQQRKEDVQAKAVSGRENGDTPADTSIPSMNVRGAVLVRGNEKTSGLPGFRENSLPALWGEYRIEIPGDSAGAADAPEGNPLMFTVLATRELLYFPEDVWAGRTISSVYRAVERSDGDTRIIASVLNNGDKGVWTALFCFPEIDLDAASLSLLMQEWLSRFSYFVSHAALPTDVSFPAIVYF